MKERMFFFAKFRKQKAKIGAKNHLKVLLNAYSVLINSSTTDTGFTVTIPT